MGKWLLTAGLVLGAVAAQAHVFDCKIKVDKGESSLTKVSDFETYMLEAKLNGLDFSAYQNEDNLSYDITVTKKEKLIVKATIPFYVDSSLQFERSGHLYVVQCSR